MAHNARMNANGYENWTLATNGSPVDLARDVTVVVADTGSYTPTKSEVARAVRRAADWLAANEKGDWPLA